VLLRLSIAKFHNNSSILIRSHFYFNWYKALDLRAPAEMLEPFAFYDLNITLSPNENPSLSSKYHPRYAPIS
ncbi:hypothetical protein AB4205_05475, partial [Vibrio sp. 10N.286.49.F3]|uniref:hypothetical protein n=1 Tax=Vibrio sp. 10N.286.49.F3 TaxID=3229704 RepID=UPI003551032E